MCQDNGGATEVVVSTKQRALIGDVSSTSNATARRGRELEERKGGEIIARA